ncbi:MAG: Bacterial alpha-L-rhamnosidase [Planctomycetes bacterium ADurb.Bin126]|nr:MAG: Bacterial alpha-L-rhamnosidase [Planctomycetes bacterium ADurb.Bin126]HQL75521.1 alpha-L-rhamnosidase N-terminal domain-containing protein [Phycisphaerae bacterium]
MSNRISLCIVLALTAAACPAETGDPLDGGQWIAPPVGEEGALPLLRKEFTLEARPRKATLRIVGLGDYDVRCNGKRLSDTGINQPWSQYEKTLYYREFDITADLQPGYNCLGVMLFNSFWHNPNPPRGRYNKHGPQRSADEPLLLRAVVVAEMTDGTTRRIGTDGGWRVAGGPVTFSHIFAGEDYDARREQGGWDRYGFDDKSWSPARLAKAPPSKLVAQHWPAIRTFDRFCPQEIIQSAPGVWLYRFGQNSSAQLRIELEGGQPGARVAFRCGEHKNDKDRLFGGYVVGCEIVVNGKRLTHQWLSFYLGMQFVEVTGAVPAGRDNPDHLPVIRSMELVHVRTGLDEGGRFECSSTLFNRTHNLIDWAMRSNMSHVLTDCPHREKLGWLEVSYLLARSLEYRYECDRWFAKILRDIRDAQEPDGRVLTVAPSYPAGRFPGAFNYTVEWGAAAVLLAWENYLWSGDKEVLAANFDMMWRFTDNVTSQAKDGLAPGGLGDWYDYGHGHGPGPSRFTPTNLSATATWARCALAVSQAAEVLGRAEEAGVYRKLHGRIAADFRRHFRDPATGRLKHTGSPQCANAMALIAQLVPERERAARVEEIVADLEKRNWQQTPGDVGHMYFIRALAEAGRSDVLHRVYSRTGVGSYGGILAKGLTALPESWDAIMDGTQSLNHCMLGHVMEWFYGYVLGVRQAPGSAGWKRVVIQPCPGPLEWARGQVKTPAGVIDCRWTRADKRFHLVVQIPPGVEASAVLPDGQIKALRPGLNALDEPVRE